MKVGDKVRVVKFDDPWILYGDMVGREGVIKHIYTEKDLFFEHMVEAEIDYLYPLMFSPDELELITE